MRRVCGCVVMSVALVSGAAGSATIDADAARGVLESVLEDTGVPALSAAVADDERVRFADAVGVRVARGSTPVESDEVFHIGSCTKAMTATLVGMLVEEGKLRWEMTLAEALPDIAGQMHEKYQGVTIAQLLRHRGGVAGFTSGIAGENALLKGLEGDARAQRLEFARRVLSAEPAQEPGEYVYSNGGYGIASAMIERVTGEAWEDVMRERLFGPLEMASAGFGWPATDEHPDAPRGHFVDQRLGGDRPQPLSDPYTLPSALDAAGDVYCSSADLAVFARMHMQGLRDEDGLLKSETVKELHRPDGEYAAGWLVGERGGARYSSHDGSAGTFYTRVTILPDDGDGVVLVAQSNTGRGYEACSRACDELLALVVGE